MSDEIERLKQKLKEDRATVRLQRQAMEEFESEKDKLRSAIFDLKQQLRQKELDISEREKQVKERHELVDEKIEYCQAQMNHINSQVQTHIKENDGLKLRLMTMSEYVDKLEAENKLLSDMAQGFHTELEVSQEELVKQNKTISHLNELIDFQAQRIKVLEDINDQHIIDNTQLHQNWGASTKRSSPKQKVFHAKTNKVQQTINTMLYKATSSQQQENISSQKQLSYAVRGTAVKPAPLSPTLTIKSKPPSCSQSVRRPLESNFPAIVEVGRSSAAQHSLERSHSEDAQPPFLEELSFKTEPLDYAEAARHPLGSNFPSIVEVGRSSATPNSSRTSVESRRTAKRPLESDDENSQRGTVPKSNQRLLSFEEKEDEEDEDEEESSHILPSTERGGVLNLRVQQPLITPPLSSQGASTENDENVPPEEPLRNFGNPLVLPESSQTNDMPLPPQSTVNNQKNLQSSTISDVSLPAPVNQPLANNEDLPISSAANNTSSVSAVSIESSDISVPPSVQRSNSTKRPSNIDENIPTSTDDNTSIKTEVVEDLTSLLLSPERIPVTATTSVTRQPLSNTTNLTRQASNNGKKKAVTIKATSVDKLLPQVTNATRHVHNGETCMACDKFYDTDPLPNVEGDNRLLSTRDRIQLHSKHRSNPQRQTTPPGFWSFNFPSLSP